MQLQKLQEAIAAYKNHLQSEPYYKSQYKWEILKNFQNHWDLDAPDLAEMYNKSLESGYTRRWWTGENFFPKEMMLRFLKESPDFSRRMFADLFNEEKDIEGRVSRFQFAMDVLLGEHKKANPLTIDNNHFHSDNHMISLYLGLRYPEKYTVIFYEDFNAFLKKIGTRNILALLTSNAFLKYAERSTLFYKKILN